MSRRQAELARDATGAWWVRDASSANGTFVNGERLDATEARPLAPGDCVQLGDTLLTFRPAVLDAPLPSAFATSPGQARPGADAPARLLVRNGLGAARVVRLDRGPVTLGGGPEANARLEGEALAGVELLVRPLAGGQHEVVNRGVGTLLFGLLPLPYGLVSDGDMLFLENAEGAALLRLHYVGAGRPEPTSAGATRSVSVPPSASWPHGAAPWGWEEPSPFAVERLPVGWWAAQRRAQKRARRWRVAGGVAVAVVGLVLAGLRGGGRAPTEGASAAGASAAGASATVPEPARPEHEPWSSEARLAGLAGANAEANGALGLEARSEGAAGRRSAARPVRVPHAVAASAEGTDAEALRDKASRDAVVRARLEQRVFGGRANAAEVERLRELCERQRDGMCGERLRALAANDGRHL